MGEPQVVVDGQMMPPADDRTVGRVVGTEDSTPLTFHVAIHPDAYLQLDDVVTTTRDVPDAAP